MRIWLFHTVINDNIGNYCQLGFLESTLLLLDDKAPFIEISNSCHANLCILLVAIFFFSFFRESFLYRLQTSLASSLVGIA